MDFNKKYIPGILIDDSDDDDVAANVVVNSTNIIEPTKLKARKTVQKHFLKECHTDDPQIMEIGIDEAGRGPLFGRVYAGAAILPKDNTTFDHTLMKDSKKFSSSKKIQEAEQYIKENAIAWAIGYEDEIVIDDINILQATQSAMHKAIKAALAKVNNDNVLLLVDGNYFKPYTLQKPPTFKTLNHITVEKGDNTYSSIAAGSILAKVARDRYIGELCEDNPELIERYSINSNKGYGAKVHIEGIKEFGITKWHRQTFGICKKYVA